MVKYSGFEILPSSLTVTPWQVPVAKFVFDQTGDKRFKSLTGAQGWNTSLVDKLNKLYTANLLPGADRVLYMSANSGVPQTSVNAFIRAVNNPAIKQDKEEGIVADVMRATRGISKVPEKVANYFPLLLVVAGGAVGAYFLFTAGKVKKVLS